jgi:hypothetical protein
MNYYFCKRCGSVIRSPDPDGRHLASIAGRIVRWPCSEKTPERITKAKAKSLGFVEVP